MSNTKVTTGEVRFSFPHVFQPHANNPGQEEKYSVTILIPKTETQQRSMRSKQQCRLQHRKVSLQNSTDRCQQC